LFALTGVIHAGPAPQDLDRRHPDGAAFAAFPLHLVLGHRANARATGRHDNGPKNFPTRHDARDNANTAGEPSQTLSAQES